MTTVHELARAVRSIPLGTLARYTARGPLELAAGRTLHALPELQLVELTGPLRVDVALAPAASRHAWSLHATDQVALQAIVAGRGVRTAFEIGTFNGGTTRVLAEAVPADGRVVTLDLPPAQFDATQHPDSFRGEQVGEAYRDSPAVDKIEQLLVDSRHFDPTPHAGRFDLVLVDGAHDHEHGLADTATALRLVAPGGVVLFDDFTPYWHGLVRGITTAMRGRHLARVAGTALGVHVAPR